MFTTTTRQHRYLSLGDTVQWESPAGDTFKMVISKIELCERKQTYEYLPLVGDLTEPVGQQVAIVQWKLKDYCVIHFTSGKWGIGSEIKHAEQKYYQFPEKERCN